MQAEPKAFTAEDHDTWRIIVQKHRQARDRQVHDLFLSGIETLGISENRIPEIEDVNKVLSARSGFRGVYVKGFEDGPTFYQMLAKRTFPIGNFIRSQNDLNYTPAPDVVHDLYGHLPFYTDKTYGDFCQAYGEVATQFSDRPEILRQFERFFWFTIEFGLVKTTHGIRIFGAGIASSTGECEYALSGRPEIRPFDVDEVRHQEYRIDEMQKVLFLLDSPDHLYRSLDILRRRIRSEL